MQQSKQSKRCLHQEGQHHMNLTPSRPSPRFTCSFIQYIRYLYSYSSTHHLHQLQLDPTMWRDVGIVKCCVPAIIGDRYIINSTVLCACWVWWYIGDRYIINSTVLCACCVYAVIGDRYIIDSTVLCGCCYNSTVLCACCAWWYRRSIE